MMRFCSSGRHFVNHAARTHNELVDYRRNLLIVHHAPSDGLRDAYRSESLKRGERPRSGAGLTATSHKKNNTEDPSNRESDKHKLAQRRAGRQFGCL
jgi:hypothetical protein